MNLRSMQKHRHELRRKKRRENVRAFKLAKKIKDRSRNISHPTLDSERALKRFKEAK